MKYGSLLRQTAKQRYVADAAHFPLIMAEVPARLLERLNRSRLAHIDQVNYRLLVENNCLCTDSVPNQSMNAKQFPVIWQRIGLICSASNKK